MQKQNADQIILSGLLVKKNIGKRDKDQGSAKPITIPRSPMFETRIAGTYIFLLYSRFADLGPNDICQLRYVYFQISISTCKDTTFFALMQIFWLKVGILVIENLFRVQKARDRRHIFRQQ